MGSSIDDRFESISLYPDSVYVSSDASLRVMTATAVQHTETFYKLVFLSRSRRKLFSTRNLLSNSYKVHETRNKYIFIITYQKAHPFKNSGKWETNKQTLNELALQTISIFLRYSLSHSNRNLSRLLRIKQLNYTVAELGYSFYNLASCSTKRQIERRDA